MEVVTVGDELALDENADSPVARRTFTHWPLPVGRVEIRDGLALVSSSDPGGFSAHDFKRIPDNGRIELLDGVAVVSPAPTRQHLRAVRRLYQTASAACPEHLEPFIGPLDVSIHPATIFEPDILVLPEEDDTPVLVVEVLSKYGRSYHHHVKYRGYQERGIPSYWIVDPDVPSITIFELDVAGRYRQTGSYSGDDVCSVEAPFPMRIRPSDLT
jgi:Uma2 family endonuclease